MTWPYGMSLLIIRQNDLYAGFDEPKMLDKEMEARQAEEQVIDEWSFRSIDGLPDSSIAQNVSA